MLTLPAMFGNNAYFLSLLLIAEEPTVAGARRRESAPGMGVAATGTEPPIPSTTNDGGLGQSSTTERGLARLRKRR